ncbi:hypothetical protein EIP91_009239 [Steccherinum ochraceum]|uniref:Uncharacterized protein n=1 Tax=Steccherinum ochraceum TaxID=92696 RepID=A0A4R0REX6_9APHY|nr:hypothetical protein EIP91_009239 [Steccherinum ochraceum]
MGSHVGRSGLVSANNASLGVSGFIPSIEIWSISDCILTILGMSGAAVGYAARSAAIASDLLVLVLTWVKTAGMRQECLKLKGFKPTLTMLLLRDGTLYFGLLLVVNVIQLILDALAPDNGHATTSFIAVTNAVTANLVARFILDLRTAFEGESGKSRVMSSLKFDVGDMAAPFGVQDSTWDYRTADNVASGHSEQFEVAAARLRGGPRLESEEIALQVTTMSACKTRGNRDLLCV